MSKKTSPRKTWRFYHEPQSHDFRSALVWTSLVAAIVHEPPPGPIVCMDSCGRRAAFADATDSLHGEATRLLDGSEQLVVQFVVGLIRWNVNPVETERRQTLGSERQRSHLSRYSGLSHQVWALGRLLVLASIWWIVKSRGPAAPEWRTIRTSEQSEHLEPVLFHSGEKSKHSTN